MIADGLGLWLGLLFLAIGIGFGWGRRHGRRDGFLEGVRFAPLELRRASLERAACIICGRGALETGNARETAPESETVPVAVPLPVTTPVTEAKNVPPHNSDEPLDNDGESPL